MTEIFEKADTSNDGKITIEEYLQLCGNYGIEVSDEDLKDVEAIANANGGVTKTDFILYVKQANMFSMFDTVDPESDHHWNEKVKMAWKLFDKNGDGRLTQLEFRWMTDKKMLTNNKIKLMFSKCDVDGDGTLDFEEFKEMILRNRLVKLKTFPRFLVSHICPSAFPQSAKLYCQAQPKPASQSLAGG